MPMLATGKTDGGFTLLEILGVIILIGLMVAVVSPEFSKGEEKTGVKYIAELIRTDLQQLRENALAEQTAFKLEFTENGYHFTLNEESIERRFTRFDFQLKIIEQPAISPAIVDDPEIEVVPKSEAEIETTDSVVKFKADGTCNGMKLQWRTTHFSGTMIISKDGTVVWRYAEE